MTTEVLISVTDQGILRGADFSAAYEAATPGRDLGWTEAFGARVGSALFDSGVRDSEHHGAAVAGLLGAESEIPYFDVPTISWGAQMKFWSTVNAQKGANV